VPHPPVTVGCSHAVDPPSEWDGPTDGWRHCIMPPTIGWEHNDLFDAILSSIQHDESVVKNHLLSDCLWALGNTCLAVSYFLQSSTTFKLSDGELIEI